MWCAFHSDSFKNINCESFSKMDIRRQLMVVSCAGWSSRSHYSKRFLLLTKKNCENQAQPHITCEKMKSASNDFNLNAEHSRHEVALYNFNRSTAQRVSMSFMRKPPIVMLALSRFPYKQSLKNVLTECSQNKTSMDKHHRIYKIVLESASTKKWTHMHLPAFESCNPKYRYLYYALSVSL